MAGGTRTVTYTVLAGDTLTTMATNLTTAINADANLLAIGVRATSSGTVITLNSKSTNLTMTELLQAQQLLRPSP